MSSELLLGDLAAPLFAQRQIERIGQPYNIAGNSLHVSASIGIALFPTDGLTARGLMVNEDAAMYYAEEQGRNGYCLFESTMNTNAHQQMQLQQDLHQALGRSEFLLHYQPKLLAPNGPIIGVEALLRWQNPGLGLVSPDRFFPSQKGLV